MPLTPGAEAVVSGAPCLAIQASPGRDGSHLSAFPDGVPEGTRLLVLAGPHWLDDLPWYAVRVGSVEGWVTGHALAPLTHYLKDLPDAKLVWLEGGHFVLDEHAPRVAAEIRATFG